jgi:hypothetical protein
MRATHKDLPLIEKTLREALRGDTSVSSAELLVLLREAANLRYSAEFDDRFAIAPAGSALRFFKARADQLARSALAEPDKEVLRHGIRVLEELIEKVQDELDNDLELMIVEAMGIAHMIGCLYPTKSSEDLAARARLRGARAKKAARRVNDPVMQVIASVVGANASKKLSIKAWNGLVSRELIKKGKKPLPPRSSKVERYLKSLPRS